MAEFNCINCKYGMTTDDYEHCGNCDKGSNFVKMSNADRIRSMSDEELAEYIFGVSESLVPCTNCLGECDFCELSDTDCKKKILDWLQSEAE